MKTIGLTGIMGAGKSSVIELLGQMQIMVLDCDVINARLLEKGEAGYCAIRTAFGDEVLDDQQAIDPKKMSAQIFQDPKKKSKLESILHPMIKKSILQELHNHAEEDIIVVEVPLLFEVHWEDAFDEVWVITCRQELLLERLETFRHISRDEAMRRIAHQMSQEEKCKKADVILHNDQDKAYLKAQIVREVERIKGEAKPC